MKRKIRTKMSTSDCLYSPTTNCQNSKIISNKKCKNNNNNNNNKKNIIIKGNNLVKISEVNSTKLVFKLIFLLSVHFTRIEADVGHITASSPAILANPPNLATSSYEHHPQQQQQQQHNTLIKEEIEHEKFIENDSNQPHIRKKRLIWITDDGRLALPPGTSLTITPTLALPLVRHPPEGFFSNMSISFPLTIDFDKLGLTDNQNPLGDFPPLFARSFGHAAGEMVGKYVAQYLHYKRKRDLHDQTATDTDTDTNSVPSRSAFRIKREQLRQKPSFLADLPELPDRFKNIFHGGERVMLYIIVEDFLSTFGMDGKACLLRTICEVHSRNLDHFGVFGEMAKLFLTVTKSPFSDLVPEYVQAQEIGEGRRAPGECYPYHKDCPKSIFKAVQNNKYSEQQNHEYHEENVEEVEAYQQPDLDSSLNEIRNRRDSFFPQSLSM